MLNVLVLGVLSTALWIVVEDAKLTSAEVHNFDEFGYSVALSGDTVVIGARRDDWVPPVNPSTGPGSAYVFTRSGSTWQESARLQSANPDPIDDFGAAVAIEGDTIAVGVPHRDGWNVNAVDAVHVFTRSGTDWTEQQVLGGTDPEQNDYFGCALALSGQTLLVGASGDSIAGASSHEGSVYVFVRSGTTWGEQTTLTASDGAVLDRFGTAVELEGDTALVGAPSVDVPGTFEAGAVYVFERSGTVWSEAAKLTSSAPAWNSKFGESIALSGSTAMVGALGVGDVCVFDRSGTSWIESQHIDGIGGFDIDLEGDMALIGAPGEYPGGWAYVYARSGTDWIQTGHFTGGNVKSTARFGEALALEGGLAVVGAALDDNPPMTSSGSAFAFRLGPPPVSYCTAGSSASGCQAAISALGLASATVPSGFTLDVADVEGSRNGLFFFGVNGRQANPWGNGSSYQCIVPPVTRTDLLLGIALPGTCDETFTRDMNAVWCPACPSSQHNPGAGATVQAQFWYRDPFNTSNQTTSLSDGVEFVVGP